MMSSFENPKTNASLLSMSAMSTALPRVSERIVVNSRPPKPAPSTTTRVIVRPPEPVVRIISCSGDRLPHEPHVRPRRAPAFRVDLPGFLVGHGALAGRLEAYRQVQRFHEKEVI